MKERRADCVGVDAGEDAGDVHGAEQGQTVEGHAGVGPPAAPRPQLGGEVVACRDAREPLQGAEQVGLAEGDRLRQIGAGQRTRVAREKPAAAVFLCHQARAPGRVGIGAENGDRSRRGSRDVHRFEGDRHDHEPDGHAEGRIAAQVDLEARRTVAEPPDVQPVAAGRQAVEAVRAARVGAGGAAASPEGRAAGRRGHGAGRRRLEQDQRVFQRAAGLSRYHRADNRPRRDRRVRARRRLRRNARGPGVQQCGDQPRQCATARPAARASHPASAPSWLAAM